MSYKDPAATTVGRAILQTPDGGYIVAGEREDANMLEDGWMARLDSSGTMVWQQLYHNNNGTRISAVDLLRGGGFVVAGISTAPGGQLAPDLWVARLDSRGNILWQKTYGGELPDFAYSVRQTADGGFIVAGSTQSFPVGAVNAWVLKLDADGNVVNQQTYNTGAETSTWGTILLTSDGGYLLYGGLYYQMWVMKLDSELHIVWNAVYPTTLGSAQLTSAQQTSDGGYILAGWVLTYRAQGRFVLSLLKLDSSGTLIWKRLYTQGIDGPDSGYVQQTSDGGYILVGASSKGFGNLPRQVVLVLKLTATGAIISQNTFGVPGPNTTSGLAIQPTSDGGWVVTGALYPTDDYPAASLLLLKLDSAGTIAQCDNIESPGSSTERPQEITPFSADIVAAPTMATVTAASAVVSPTFAASSNLCR